MIDTTQHLSIEGMTCKACEASVKKSLNAIKEVKEVDVSLEKKEAILLSSSPISLDKLSSALGPKYTLKLLSPGTDSTTSYTQDKFISKLKTLKPLLLILFFISVASILLHLDSYDTHSMMLDFMGMFLVVFSFFKLLDIKGFASSFAMYDPLANILPLYGKVYPFLELILGVSFFYRYQLVAIIGITLVLLSITTIGVIRALTNKKTIRCACLGTTLKLPMTEATLIENLIMIAMGAGLLIQLLS